MLEVCPRKGHVLMMGSDFPDGFSAPEPQAEDPPKEEALYPGLNWS